MADGRSHASVQPETPLSAATAPACGHEARQLRLASDRTMLSKERTYAAWVRTGLAALASGVATRAFVSPAVSPKVALAMASLLVMFAGFCFVAGVWRELRPPMAIDPQALKPVPAGILISANALMLVVTFTALASLWTTIP